MNELLPAPSPSWALAIRHSVRAASCRLSAMLRPDDWAVWELMAARERHSSDAAIVTALVQDEEGVS